MNFSKDKPPTSTYQSREQLYGDAPPAYNAASSQHFTSQQDPYSSSNRATPPAYGVPNDIRNASSPYAPPAGPPPSHYRQQHLNDQATPADESVGTPAEEERLMNEELAWTHRATIHSAGNPAPRLPVPVCIPQIGPDMRASFTRCWAPILETHDVRIEELCQFIDHLNVCKAASPPLQILNLAGTVTGFVPGLITMVIGNAVSAASIAAMYATARVRIGKYVTRANAEYFNSRGLRVRIAKQATLPAHIAKQPDQQLVIPVIQPRGAPGPAVDDEYPTTLRDRRLAALRGQIADLYTGNLPPERRQKNALDQLAAKQLQKQMAKKEEKEREDALDSSSSDSDFSPTGESKELRKLQREMQKVNLKAEKEKAKAKKDKDVRKAEEDRLKDLRKIEEDMAKEERKMAKKGRYVDKSGMSSGYGGPSAPRLSKKDIKSAKKFLWIVIENLDDPTGPAGEPRSAEQEQRMAGLM